MGMDREALTSSGAIDRKQSGGRLCHHGPPLRGTVVSRFSRQRERRSRSKRRADEIYLARGRQQHLRGLTVYAQPYLAVRKTSQQRHTGARTAGCDGIASGAVSQSRNYRRFGSHHNLHRAGGRKTGCVPGGEGRSGGFETVRWCPGEFSGGRIKRRAARQIARRDL